MAAASRPMTERMRTTVKMGSLGFSSVTSFVVLSGGLRRERMRSIVVVMGLKRALRKAGTWAARKISRSQ